MDSASIRGGAVQQSVRIWRCDCGEIGKLSGLKTRRLERALPVRFRPVAPTNPGATQSLWCVGEWQLPQALLSA